MERHATGDAPAGTVAGDIEAMRRHVAHAPEIYRPGAFWEDLIATNLEMLRSEGVENFKRTVSNNYFNWLVIGVRDPQMQAAFKRWLRRPALAPLRTEMEQPGGLRSPGEAGAYALSRKAALLYRFFVGMAWERAREEDRLGLTERLEEPPAGNPIRVRSRGRGISQDLANSILECTFAASSGCVRDGARVAELGAGYGRVAHVYSQAARLTYCVFDIPPALAVAQWYLEQVLGPESIVRFEPTGDFGAIEARLRPGTVAFFTADQMAAFPDGWFDLTQTISTLPEMPAGQAEHFLALLAAKSSDALFLKQWMRWRNDADGAELSEGSYRLPPPWQLSRRRVDPIQPLFFNQLWRRSVVGRDDAAAERDVLRRPLDRT